MTKLTRTAVIGVIGVWCAGLMADIAFSEEAKPSGWAAACVKMDVPKKLLTDQVFLAKITMKNTGTEAWGPPNDRHAHLYSESPRNNVTWGTFFIYQGQGHDIQPGAEWTYASWFKAPSEPGTYAFQWQLGRDRVGTEYNVRFGEPTAKEMLVVEKRPEEPKAAPEPPRDPKEKRVLKFEDFEYVGSFRPPGQVGDGVCTYSEIGMALRKMPDGSRRLFMNYTHPGSSLFEADIPALVKLENGNMADLKTAEVKKLWGAISAKDKDGKPSWPVANSGFWWDEGKKTLYWSFMNDYWTGGDLPALNATKLEDDGKIGPVVSWTVPNQKWHWGGVIKLPKAFADKYTGGRTLALGFGGYYSICAACSRGPALSAISEPDPSKPRVEVLPLLGYHDPACAPRDGDYFFGYEDCYWWTPPKDPKHGYWTMCDNCHSGVFIDLPDCHAYIAFPRMGTGRLGYDYGAGTVAGVCHYWYIYDPKDLGEAALGKKKPDQVFPRTMTKVAYPEPDGVGFTGVSSACFDEEKRLLYICKLGSAIPYISVYRVTR